jgi:ABC-2 type transport system permease protein
MNFKERVKKIFFYKNIIWNIALKELKAKYTGSVLGVWWAIATPILLTGAISFVFTKVIKIDIENFPLFSLAAILPWFFFSVSLSEATSSLLHNAQLLKQFAFPPESLPIASVLSNFINFIFGLIFILPLFIIFKVKIITVLGFLPIVLILHLLFTCGLALLLSCINIFFRDINHLLGIILMFWFWITPIFYSIDMIPKPYAWVCNLNPMAVYITMYRNILFDARSPLFFTFYNAFFISIATSLLGYWIFYRFEHLLIKRI